MAKMNMGNLLKQAQQMQDRMEKVQSKAAEQTVEGSAGGGMVTAVANGKYELLRINIDPEVVDPEDTEMLEDLVVAAVNQVMVKAQEMMASEMSKATGGLMPGLPGGLKLPGM